MNKFFSSENKYFKGKLKKVFLVVFLLGFFYVLLPGPKSIGNFPPLNPSTKSDLSGDTWQNPNIVAYFSDYTRSDITKFYYQKFTSMHLFGKIFPPISLNHPPERAYQYIRDQQESTFLEEYVYPLRESIYVNGYEPLVVNQMHNRAEEVGFVGNHINYRGAYYNSKATLRYYPSGVIFRVLVYLGIWFSSILLYKLFRKSLQA